MVGVLTIHLVGGIFFMVVNVALAVWGWLVHRAKQVALPAAYWPWLRISAGLFALEILTGVILLLMGYKIPTWLHLMYAGLIVLTVGAQEMLRPGANMRRVLTESSSSPVFDEAYWFALLALGNALFAMRQVMTGILGF